MIKFEKLRLFKEMITIPAVNQITIILINTIKI